MNAINLLKKEERIGGRHGDSTLERSEPIRADVFSFRFILGEAKLGC